MFGEYVRTVMAGLIPWLASQMAVIAFVPSSVGPVGSPIRVSKETTFFTEPLTESGEVDFVAALNQHYSAGVSHDENAAVILAPMCGKLNWWHAPEGAQQWLQEMQRQLGSDPQLAWPELVPTDALKISGNRWDDCQMRPWLRTAHRDVEALLLRNEAALQLVHVALRQPGYFRPTFILHPGGSLVEVTLPDVQHHRSVCRMLAARTMLAMQEQRFADARRDLIDMQRLARITSRTPFVIQQLVSGAVETIAVRNVESVYLYDPKLPTSELEEYRRECRELPAFYPMWESVHYGERAMALQLAQQMRQRGAAAWAELGDGPLVLIPGLSPEVGQQLTNFFLGRSIDWNLVVVEVNQEYDASVEAFREGSPQRVDAALVEVEQQRRLKVDQTASRVMQHLLWGSRTDRSHLMAMRMVQGLMPIVGNLAKAQHRRERLVALSALRTSLLLHFRRAETFPKELDELVPELLTAEELAGFKATAQQVTYESEGKSFRLMLDDANTAYSPPAVP